MAFDPKIKNDLIKILDEDRVKDDRVTLYTYRSDALILHPTMPMGVVFPENREELVAIVKLLHANQITFLPRGAGTGLSGGAIPKEGSVIIEMFRFRQIYDIDFANRSITVGPGVVNIKITEHVKENGYCFVPDPSSQKACTVGGNVAENSGGPHTLKYGVTVNHILGIEVVLPDGEVVELGGKQWGAPGPDLLGLFVGSEGTFGIVTKITCRLTPLPEKVITLLGIFPSVRDACSAVSNTIREGIIPAAMELIDNVVIQAVEKTIAPGFPLDAEAVLVVELEDMKDGIEEEASRVQAILNENNATEVRRAKNEEERALIWKARKEAFGALGTISPSYYVQDGVIPRSALPDVLGQISDIAQKYNLTIANVFHAGDGNLHPLILYNSKIPEEIEKADKAGIEILDICVSLGGSLSGEHGIGLEKQELMGTLYSSEDLSNMEWVRSFFNPQNLLNPGKIFPTPGKCAETKMGPQIVQSKSGVVA
ncbi:MAG: FAD-binding protein [SAR324 cluster bacterium]|nr:FAD-binding protein [SAR324 cluster bacterium]